MFEDKSIVELNGVKIVAQSAGAQLSKLRQMSQGFVYDAEQTAYSLGNAKIEALSDLLAHQQGRPTLVAYFFKEDLKRLLEFQPHPHIGSGTSPKQSIQLIKRWNSGELPVMYVHPQSVGHGLNLQKGGNHLIWYALPDSLEFHDQLIGRLRRQGQEADRVFCRYLKAVGTKDAKVLYALKTNKNIQDYLLEGLRDE